MTTDNISIQRNTTQCVATGHRDVSISEKWEITIDIEFRKRNIRCVYVEYKVHICIRVSDFDGPNNEKRKIHFHTDESRAGVWMNQFPYPTRSHTRTIICSAHPDFVCYICRADMNDDGFERLLGGHQLALNSISCQPIERQMIWDAKRRWIRFLLSRSATSHAENKKNEQQRLHTIDLNRWWCRWWFPVLFFLLLLLRLCHSQPISSQRHDELHPLHTNYSLLHCKFALSSLV